VRRDRLRLFHDTHVVSCGQLHGYMYNGNDIRMVVNRVDISRTKNRVRLYTVFLHNRDLQVVGVCDIEIGLLVG
jgi:hypothetical protein